MIPKTINYCWFGKTEKNELFYRCLYSWKKYLPDYKIIEWNEDNFDVMQNDYVREAYEAKKYAFVSDYARIKIIYDNGGIYFDTDVEVLRDMSKILDKGPFIGCEQINEIASGLGFAADKHNYMVKAMLDQYKDLHFNIDNIITCVKYNTYAFIENGWSGNNRIEKVKDIYVYPVEYFSPFNYLTGEINITQNTYTYHHGNASWLPEYERKLLILKKKLVSKYGKKIGKLIYYFVKFIVLLFKNPKKILRR